MARLLLAALLLVSLPAPVEPAQTLTPVEPMPATDFTLADVDGKRHKLSANRGKVVLVNFWATWCPPCRTEMPSMQRAWDKLKDENFMMYAVNVGEDEETIFGFSFATGTELKFPILLDKDGSVVKSWPVLGLPTTFIIDRQGRVAYRAVGGREWDDPQLLKEIRALMKEPRGG